MATYGSATGVQALLPVLGTLSGSTTPTSTQVTTWLGEGYAIINRNLANAGYSVPISATATCYAELQGLNDLYAGALCITARGLDSVSGGEENRAEAWLTRFNTQLASLVASDLTALGATLATTASGTATRRRVRTTQVKRVDGYSAVWEDDPELDH